MNILIIDPDRSYIPEIAKAVQQHGQFQITQVCNTLQEGYSYMKQMPVSVVLFSADIKGEGDVDRFYAYVSNEFPLVKWASMIDFYSAQEEQRWSKLRVSLIAKNVMNHMDIVNILVAWAPIRNQWEGVQPAPSPIQAKPTAPSQPTSPLNPYQTPQVIPAMNTPQPIAQAQIGNAMLAPVMPSTLKNQCISIHSPKGGVGKSTISKELATAYSMIRYPVQPGQPDGIKVCLIDLNLDYGNISNMFKLASYQHSGMWADDIESKLRQPQYKDRKPSYSFDQFKMYLTHTSTGLYVLAAPPKPAQALKLAENPEWVSIMIESLKSHFDLIIIDTGNNLNDYTLVAMGLSQQVVIVATIDVPAINNIQAFLETLKELDFPREKLRMIVNMVPKRTTISISDIQRAVDLPLLGAVPDIADVKQAGNYGRLLVTEKATEFTKAIRLIGQQIVPVFPPEKTGLLSKLFG